MRRLAAELNVTAMSVYWYVDTKDELLELALDAVFGELRRPDPDTGDWREQLRALAREHRSLLVRHPWMSPLVGTYLNIGPHSMEFSRAVQRVMRRSGLPAYRLTGAISAVFQFVYGYGTIEGHLFARAAGSGMSPDEYFQDSMRAVAESSDTAPDVIAESRAIMSARGGETVAEMLDRDFEFAWTCWWRASRRWWNGTDPAPGPAPRASVVRRQPGREAARRHRTPPLRCHADDRLALGDHGLPVLVPVGCSPAMLR